MENIKISTEFIKNDIKGYCLSQFHTSEGFWSVCKLNNNIYHAALYESMYSKKLLEYIEGDIDTIVNRVNR